MGKIAFVDYLGLIIDMWSRINLPSLRDFWSMNGDGLNRFLGAVVVIAANSGGAWTPIGDVTTTMLWIHGHISSARTIQVMRLIVDWFQIINARVYDSSRKITCVELSPDSWRWQIRSLRLDGVCWRLTEAFLGLQDLFIPSAISLIVPLTLMSFSRWVPALFPHLMLHFENSPPWRAKDRTWCILSLCRDAESNSQVSSPALTSEQMAPRGQLVFGVGIGALLFVPVFKSLTGLPPFLGMLLGLGTLWLLTDAIHYGETGRQQLKVPQALSRIDTQGVLFFLGILLSVGRCVNHASQCL